MLDLPETVLIHPGQNYTIDLGEVVDNFGREISVTIKTFHAWRFVTFYPAEKAIKIDGEKIFLSVIRPRFTIAV